MAKKKKPQKTRGRAKLARTKNNATASPKKKLVKAKPKIKLKKAKPKKLNLKKKPLKAKKLSKKELRLKRAEEKQQAEQALSQTRHAEIMGLLENKKIHSFLIDVAGENAPPIAREITIPLTAEDISKKSGLKISHVRIVLNKMHSQGIVEYTRMRNEDTGWYSYLWQFKDGRMLKLIEEKEKMIGLLQANGEEEQQRKGFACRKCDDVLMQFEDAMDALFKCPQCGKSLESLNGPQ